MKPADCAVEPGRLSVSVVIPVYNLQHFLPATIESVLLQDYEGEFPIIVLDDGSTDKSLQIAQQLAASQPRISVHHQENSGRAGARNRLLDLTNTDLVAWLDGDDIAAPGWLQQQVQFLEQNQSCVAVSAHGYAMTADSQPIGPILHPLLPQEINRRHLEGDASVFFQSCVTVRRSAVLAAGGYDVRHHCAEDYSLWLRLSDQGELHNLDRFHLYYRVHASSANWTVSTEQRTQGAEILEEARRRHNLPPLPDSERRPKLPPAKTDDWHRRIYWINIALRNGNPKTAAVMCCLALRRHPSSLVVWLMLLTAVIDTLLFFGNRTARLRPGLRLQPGRLPLLSSYRLGRWLNRKRRWLLSS